MDLFKHLIKESVQPYRYEWSDPIPEGRLIVSLCSSLCKIVHDKKYLDKLELVNYLNNTVYHSCHPVLQHEGIPFNSAMCKYVHLSTR